MGGSGQTDSNITSEYILSNGSVIAGPDIPDMGLEWHCIVRLEDGKVIIINQFNGQLSQEFQFFFLADTFQQIFINL